MITSMEGAATIFFTVWADTMCYPVAMGSTHSTGAMAPMNSMVELETISCQATMSIIPRPVMICCLEMQGTICFWGQPATTPSTGVKTTTNCKVEKVMISCLGGVEMIKFLAR